MRACKKIDHVAVENFRYFISGLKDANLIIKWQESQLSKYNYATQKKMMDVAEFYLMKLGAIIPRGEE